MEMNASANGPSERYKFGLGEAKDRLLEEPANPGFFPFWRDESGRSGYLSGERQLEGELGECDHEAVCRIIPTDLISAKSERDGRKPPTPDRARLEARARHRRTNPGP